MTRATMRLPTCCHAQTFPDPLPSPHQHEELLALPSALSAALCKDLSAPIQACMNSSSGCAPGSQLGPPDTVNEAPTRAQAPKLDEYLDRMGAERERSESERAKSPRKARAVRVQHTQPLRSKRALERARQHHTKVAQGLCKSASQHRQRGHAGVASEAFPSSHRLPVLLCECLASIPHRIGTRPLIVRVDTHLFMWARPLARRPRGLADMANAAYVPINMEVP